MYRHYLKQGVERPKLMYCWIAHCHIIGGDELFIFLSQDAPRFGYVYASESNPMGMAKEHPCRSIVTMHCGSLN